MERSHRQKNSGKKQAELKLSVFDLLKQNNIFSQPLNNFNLIQASTTRVLQQYFMFTFTYSLRNFGKGRTMGGDSENRRRGWEGTPPYDGGMRSGGSSTRQGFGPIF